MDDYGYRWAKAWNELGDEPAPNGWESYLVGEEDAVVAWFSSARNAAAWVAMQDEARIGTVYEYRVRASESYFGHGPLEVEVK